LLLTKGAKGSPPKLGGVRGGRILIRQLKEIFMSDILNKIKSALGGRNKFFPSRIAKFFGGLIGVYQRWENKMFDRFSSKTRPFETRPTKSQSFRIGMYLIGGLIIGGVIFFTGDYVFGTMVKVGSGTYHAPQVNIILDSIDQYLVRYYKMDLADMTHVKDYSLAGINGTIKSGCTSLVENGRVGAARDLGGGSGITTNEVFDTTKDFSMSVWINGPRIHGAIYAIVSNYFSRKGFWLSTYSSYFSIGKYGCAGGDVEGLIGYHYMSYGSWYLITLVYTVADNTLRMYKDGTLFYSMVLSACNWGSDRPVVFGSWGDLGHYYWNGLMDEARIYDNHALSSEEIMALYNKTADQYDYDSLLKSKAKLGNATTQAKADAFQTIKGANLIRYYKMDLATASTVKDFSDYNTAGTLGGNTTIGNTGEVGAGAYLDGTTDYISTGSDVINESNDFSLATWFKLDTTSGTHTIFSNAPATVGAGGIILYVYPNADSAQSKFRLYSLNANYNTEVFYPLTSGIWYHAAVTYHKIDGSNGVLTLYLNGASIGSLTGASGLVGSNVYNTFFGADPTNGANSFRGSLDEARIYSKALSQNEILDLYNLPQNVTTGNESKGLIGRWSLAQDNLQSSTRFGDLTPYNHVGISETALAPGNFTTDPFNNNTGSMVFDGASNAVSIGNIGAIKSVSFWIYGNDSNDEILDFGGGNNLSLVDGVLTVTGFVSPTIYIDNVESSNLGLSGWHKVVIDDPNGLAVSDFNIGKIGVGYFNGRLSDVRLYNRFLSASELGLVCGSYSVKGAGSDTNTYGTVVTLDGSCWLDRNLGAMQVATSVSDSAAYGWYYQWGRATDGHQIFSAGNITTTLSNSDQPVNSKFIYGMGNPWDWRSPQNDNLWQGVNGINNPCPNGWHVPTKTEFLNALNLTTSGYVVINNLFNSALKMPAAGYRSYANPTVISSAGGEADYWVSTITSTFSYYLSATINFSHPFGSGGRAYGFSVRCTRDD